MKVSKLSGLLRANVGKKDASALRKEERVPCVLYGQGEQFHFSVRKIEVEKLVLPFLTKLLKTADQPIIKWPNRKPMLETQIQKILNLTRG